jgi:hypothetical protein
MNTDTIRLHYTYIIALVIVVGAGVLMYIKLPEIEPEVLIGFFGTAFGFVLGFVFNRESSVGSQRATERAVSQGANAGVIPTTTTTTITD